MLKVSEVMCSEVITFHPSTTLGEAITVLCDQRISGAPVVADDSQLLGIISEFTLMDVLFDPALKAAQVEDYMDKEVHSLAKEDSLTQAVHKFALYGVRRLPVVENGKLVGIVSRRDLLAATEKIDQPLAMPLDVLMPELKPSFQERDQNAEVVDFA